jgi:hypothetical protein
LHRSEKETLKEAVEEAVAKGAYLSSANLSRADLSRADLSRANLSSANLSGADLSSADLSRANLSRANLSGAYLSSAYLSSANLSGADLSSADLSRANLSSANLSGAYLSSADLSSADLSRANLSGATLIGERPILILGPMGSRGTYLLSAITDQGVRIEAGCWRGPLTEFAARVETEHGDNEHGREYRAAILMIEAHAAIWTPATAAPSARIAPPSDPDTTPIVVDEP